MPESVGLNRFIRSDRLLFSASVSFSFSSTLLLLLSWLKTAVRLPLLG